MKFNGLISIIIIFELSACNSLTQTVQDDTKQEIIRDQIVFHEFMAQKNSEKVSITEIDRVFRNGKIKEVNREESRFNHPVELILLGKSDTRITSIFIEHPLIQEFEFADDKGNLKRVTSYEDSAIFTVRYNNIDKLWGISFLSVSNDTLPINVKLEIKK